MARIIDADGHIVEPRKLWEEYVEPEFRDSVIRVERSREGLDEFWINGERRRGPGGSIIASVIPGGYLSAERTRTASWEDILPGSWDPHARIKSDGRGRHRRRLPLPVLLPDLRRPRGSAAGRHGEPRILVVAVDQVEGRVEEGDVDTFLVHHFDPRVRIPTARSISSQLACVRSR